METRSNHVLVGGVVLILFAVLALFMIWIARFGAEGKREYDIYFKQSVDGLAKGSAVNFSGVPIGQVKDIALDAAAPEFVRVRVSVDDKTPILLGTTATIQGSFTGPSTVALDGAQSGKPLIDCSNSDCRRGVPVIPAKPGGLGALLSNAPQLLDRLTRLTEKLTSLLSDRNQASIAGILENTNKLSKALSDRGPEIAATLAETRITIQKAGVAAQQIGDLAQTTNGVLSDDVKPAVGNLNKAIASAQKSMDTLNDAIGDARPGLQAFSKQTIPETGQLIHDLREMAEALQSVAEKVDRGGVSSIAGRPKLPDYKPGKGGE
jgi:phospholipid/cholesterol/gamma-HCH transport system substrate-binding protein